jgi:predicted site-specific integrase-resolvase
MSDDHFVSGIEAKKTLGVSASTLRLWAKEKKIEIVRNPGCHRRYNIAKFVKDHRKTTSEDSKDSTASTRKKFAYCRVSSGKQADDLARQVEYIKSKYPRHEVITDIGSGLNYKRKGLWKILECSMRGEVEEVVVSYTDRLARFAHELIEKILQFNNTKLVVENRRENISSEQELSEDLLAIVHVFSCRINGKRRYNKTKQSTSAVTEEKPGKRQRSSEEDDSCERLDGKVHKVPKNQDQVQHSD